MPSIFETAKLEFHKPAIEFSDGATWSWGSLLVSTFEDGDAISYSPGATVAVEAGNGVFSLYALLVAMRLGINLKIVDSVDLELEQDQEFHRIVAARVADIRASKFPVHSDLPAQREGFVLNPAFSVELRTSGSSGRPKSVRIAADAIRFQGASVWRALGLTVDDRQLFYMPLNYVYGLSVVMTWVFSGGCLVESQYPVTQSSQFFRQLVSRKITVFSGVPYTYSLMLKWGVDKLVGSALRMLTQAGGKLKERERNVLNTLSMDLDLMVMYGQTEFGGRIAQTTLGAKQEEHGCVGQPLPGVEIYIHDEDEQGEGIIFVSSPSMCVDPQQLLECKVVDNQRYYSTGDYGAYREGKLFVSGRNKTFVKLGGRRIPSLALEQLIEGALPGSECFAFADAGRQERLILVIFVSEALPVKSQMDTYRYIRERVAEDSELLSIIKDIPSRFIVAIGEVPRLSNGKAAVWKVHEIAKEAAIVKDPVHIWL